MNNTRVHNNAHHSSFIILPAPGVNLWISWTSTEGSFQFYGQPYISRWLLLWSGRAWCYNRSSSGSGSVCEDVGRVGGRIVALSPASCHSLFAVAVEDLHMSWCCRVPFHLASEYRPGLWTVRFGQSTERSEKKKKSLKNQDWSGGSWVLSLRGLNLLHCYYATTTVLLLLRVL